ncbi:hypothetical protein AaE_009321 [Aphanomyces astaci]|uniref:Transposase Tc1-like domain-containing protein n=1 Tax=Aphanomyces astaci TaxID=112090 RepID=A0A6A5A8N9_APHAT|nr:hypothetical protein AaE_009321 [Aphanomyces astaci]
MPQATTRKDLPDDERLKLYHELLETKVNGRLPHGHLNVLLDRYGISRQTLSKVWQRGQRSKEQTGLACVARRKKGHSGRPRKRSVQQIEAAIKSAAPHLRMTLATLSTATGIPPTTLWRLLQTKKLRRRISRIKPMMTDKHKTDRVSFARSFVRSTASGQLRWHDMMDRVHIDEKWFYVTLINRRYYLWHDEDVPIRRCTSKRHIIKVMFLTAVARPRYDAGKKEMWDGKIGTWPFVSMVAAKRKSKNRERGTMVTTPLTVTKPIYRQFLVDNVIPSIKRLWPGRRNLPIFIQQDNARPHVQVDDAAVATAGRSNGWMIQLTAQPAMSPDFNVLDLGFFNSIQCLQHRQIVTTIDELVSAVSGAFNDLDWRVLDKTFMTLQKVLEESLKIGGDNAYKLPHMHKDKLARQGPQNPQLACDPEVVSVIEEMNGRKEFERRVDNLSGVLASCEINGSINMSNIDNLCAMAHDMDLVDNDEE